eukprot:SAG31_NODE_38682_length_294_cov_0.800000_1_plen_73_part_01
MDEENVLYTGTAVYVSPAVVSNRQHPRVLSVAGMSFPDESVTSRATGANNDGCSSAEEKSVPVLVARVPGVGS